MDVIERYERLQTCRIAEGPERMKEKYTRGQKRTFRGRNERTEGINVMKTIGSKDLGRNHKKIWTISRFVRVILAQGPCSSLYRYNFIGCLRRDGSQASTRAYKVVQFALAKRGGTKRCSLLHPTPVPMNRSAESPGLPRT